MPESQPTPTLLIKDTDYKSITSGADEIATRIKGMTKEFPDDYKKKQEGRTTMFKFLLGRSDTEFSNTEAGQMRDEFVEGGKIDAATTRRWNEMLERRDEVRESIKNPGKPFIFKSNDQEGKPSESKSEPEPEKPAREKTSKEKIEESKDLGQALIEYNRALGFKDPDLISAFAQKLAEFGKIDESIKYSSLAIETANSIRNTGSAETMKDSSESIKRSVHSLEEVATFAIKDLKQSGNEIVEGLNRAGNRMQTAAEEMTRASRNRS